MADDSDTPEMARLLLRLPPELKDRVQERAASHGRSMNTEIVAILEESLHGLSGARIRDLVDDYRRIKEHRSNLARSLERAEEQQESIERELVDRIKRVEKGLLPDAGKLAEEALNLIKERYETD